MKLPLDETYKSLLSSIYLLKLKLLKFLVNIYNNSPYCLNFYGTLLN